MAEAREIAAWNHTAHLLALTANLNRDPKKGRTFVPADFHPYMPQSKRKRRGVPPQVFHEALIAEAKRRRQERARPH